MKIKKNINFNITKYLLIISFIILCIHCEKRTHSIGIDNINEGKIFINDKPIIEFVADSVKSNSTFYFLNIKNGEYKFTFLISDTIRIDTLIQIGGECYLSVDLKSGEISGF